MDERWELVERVAASRYFLKSNRLRNFLFYIGRSAISKPGVPIHEQEIAAEVFGRPVEATTGEDSIVRVHASQLRKRLEQYFSSEGAGETLVIEVPRGNYTPVFKARDPVMAPVRRDRRVFVWCGAALAVVLLAAGVWAARGRLRAALPRSGAETALASFWSPFFQAGRPTVVVLADSNLGVVEDVLQRPVTLSEYLSRDYLARIDALRDPALRRGMRAIMSRQHTSMADAGILRRLVELGGRGDRLSVVFSREFTIRPLKSDNAILLGSKRSNPWVELFEDRLNFRFGFNEQTMGAFIENRNPQPGEERVYHAVTGSGPDTPSYCLIASLPNLNRTGQVLLIAGTEAEGTEAGGEFVTSENWMAELSRQLGIAEGQRFPCFEVLLKNLKVGGTAPRFEVLARRTLKP